MGLNSIKLAGFKSFVDPTQLPFESNLTAIVGPNGCGKSNIVDAIHCVLGSTSKNLRAELMADVIFNGTTTRKPVSQAAIELVFDNSDGRISGEYTNYPEISIRREISRDGQSTYYINSTRCRRKDVTDIFLGTGLGNNSYAIIEQGMISRLTEARPEELRLHIEEAAGTSKYKERRRETESRIKQTKENLERLSDILEEQAKQLQHLQRQAKAAEKYKELKKQQNLLRAELQVLRREEVNAEFIKLERQIKEEEIKLQANLAELTNHDKKIESRRLLRSEYHEKMNEVQSEYFLLSNQISKTEQQILHTKERKKQIENDFEQTEHNFHEIKQQYLGDQAHYSRITEDIMQVEQLWQASKSETENFQNKLIISEKQMLLWQDKWDDFNRASSQALKEVEVEKIKITHLEQRRQSLNQRQQRLIEEKNSSDINLSPDELMIAREKQQNFLDKIHELQEQLNFIQKNIEQKKIKQQQIQQNITEQTKQLRYLQAQHASMQALQQIALGKNNNEKLKWLVENQIDQLPSVAENLEVEAGWEIAAETVLVNYLDAICIEDFKHLASAIEKINHANIAFCTLHETVPSSRKNDSLLTKIKTTLPIAALLNTIFVAENLTEALEKISMLAPNESIITKGGVWLSQTFLRVAKQTSEKTGVIQREQDLKALQQQINDQQSLIATEDNFLQDNEYHLKQLFEDKDTKQQHLQIVKSKNSELIVQINAKENLIREAKEKYQVLIADLSEIEIQLIEVNNQLEDANNKVKVINQEIHVYQGQRDQLLGEKEQSKSALDQIRQLANLHIQKENEYQVRLESMKSQIHYLTQNISRGEKQLASIEEKRQILMESLANTNDPLPELNLGLQQALERQAIVQQDLLLAKQNCENIEVELGESEKIRQRLEKEIEQLRTNLEEQRIHCQGFLIKKQNFEEQIRNAGFNLQELLQNLIEGLTIRQTEEKLQFTENRINRLGPINLAAIDEYSVLEEKKVFMDKQQNDLLEALEILENAIRRIDRETRVKFKETFEKLNNFFKSIFTEIFGGGVANLELTSEDVLETGVVIKAQPPGKKNTSIHLLSGGEKALTAIALVFAIFNLNPAPFCVLDEVDAPLDDVNVGRFCKLVKKMSEKVQFIFISHNKITIEMGQQLAGVTMHEPGVSRLVSVDIQQAIDMASV